MCRFSKSARVETPSTGAAEATAAGGAPAAGGGLDGGGGTPLVIQQANSVGEVNSGFLTSPASIGFPEILPAELVQIPPTVSVTVTTDTEIVAPGTTPVGVFMSPAGPTIIEGTAPTTQSASFTILLDHAFVNNVTVSYAFVNGTAINGQDFIGVPGTVTIPAGETSITVPVQIIQDSLDEGLNDTANAENLTIVLTNATNATIGSGGASAVLHIVDDDTPTISISDGTPNPQSGYGWERYHFHGDNADSVDPHLRGLQHGERHRSGRLRLRRAKRHGDLPGR
jgi:hypothetical protein